MDALSRADRPEKQLDMIGAALTGGASAVLLAPASAEIAEEAGRLCGERGAKLVLLDACEACRGSAPYVGTDHRASGMEAAGTLLQISGAKRILILYSEGGIQANAQRREAMAKASARCLAHWVPAAGANPARQRRAHICGTRTPRDPVLDVALTEAPR